jgi:hypothetical protein
MLTLNTMICDLWADNYCRRMGDYICQTAIGEVLGVTLNVLANPARIMGCATYSPEFLEDQNILEMIVDGREHYPLVATATQKIAIANSDDMTVKFQELRECTPGELSIVPMPMGTEIHLIMAPITQIRRVMPGHSVEGYAIDTGPTLATLKIHGAKSYATVSGIVHV